MWHRGSRRLRRSYIRVPAAFAVSGLMSTATLQVVTQSAASAQSRGGSDSSVLVAPPSTRPSANGGTTSNVTPLTSSPNPGGCQLRVDNAHWTGGAPYSLTVKVNGYIYGCSYPPEAGYIQIDLYKTGNGTNHFQASCYVDTRQGASFIRSGSTYQLPSQCAQITGQTRTGISTTFFGTVAGGGVEYNGAWYMSGGVRRSPNNFTADNFWTPTWD